MLADSGVYKAVGDQMKPSILAIFQIIHEYFWKLRRNYVRRFPNLRLPQNYIFGSLAELRSPVSNLQINQTQVESRAELCSPLSKFKIPEKQNSIASTFSFLEA